MENVWRVTTERKYFTLRKVDNETEEIDVAGGITVPPTCYQGCP